MPSGSAGFEHQFGQARAGPKDHVRDGFRMNALPVAIATPNIHIGIIAGKLNGVMPAPIPSG